MSFKRANCAQPGHELPSKNELGALETVGRAVPGKPVRHGKIDAAARWPLPFLILLMLVCVSARGATLTAKLDRDAITLGEAATLSLSFEGTQLRQPPTVPSQNSLSVQYMGESTHLTIVKGESSYSRSFNYRIVPTQAGEFTIPAITARVDNQVVRSQPLRLRVLKPDANAQASAPKTAFLRTIAGRTNVFVGEVFPVEIQLYYISGENIQHPQLPGEGFVLGKFAQPGQTRVQAGGTIYNVVSFKLSASAVKTGTLTLGPAECEFVGHFRQTQRRTGDVFDDIFDSLAGRVVRQPVTVKSEPVKIQVLPLPEEGRPADFTGAVGSYEWAVTASPTNVATGDPITLKIQIAGEGALDALSLPTQDWRDFKAYPPNAKVDTTDPLGINGVKSFEQVIIPQNADVKEIPALAFSYFDPQQRKYRTLTHEPVAITVKPANGTQPQPTVLSGAKRTDESPAPVRDIAHIKPYLGTLSLPQPALLQRPWFLLLQAVPVLAWLVGWGWRKQQEILARDPRRRRRAEVNASVRRGLQELPHLAGENRADEFFATMFRLLQEQLGERLDLPASAITESVLDDRLPGLGVPADLTARLHELFRLCNQARYAGQFSSQELHSLVPQVEAALRELQQAREAHAR